MFEKFLGTVYFTPKKSPISLGKKLNSSLRKTNQGYLFIFKTTEIFKHIFMLKKTKFFDFFSFVPTSTNKSQAMKNDFFYNFIQTNLTLRGGGQTSNI